MKSLESLDAVITGYAYENATFALGILEGSRPGQLSTEMVCTLDNFIRVVLFSSRIYIYPLHSEVTVEREPSNETITRLRVTEKPIFGASAEAQSRFNDEDLFELLPVHDPEDEPDEAFARTQSRLSRVVVDRDFWLYIQASWPEESRVMFQESLVYDVVFMETAIQKCGLKHFKPVFPGEHIYLGLRDSSGYPQTLADLAARRIRTLVKKKLSAINDQQVPLGALHLPELPPLFVARLLSQCSDRSKLVETLFEIRNSRPFVRFRECVIKCHEMLASEDEAERQNASKVIKMINEFDYQMKNTLTEWINISFESVMAFIAALKGDLTEPAKEILKLSKLLFKVLSQGPVFALYELDTKTRANPAALDAFFKRFFDDHFSLDERHSIATMLCLPENADDWRKEKVKFDAYPGRFDLSAGPMARPLWTRTKNPSLDFDTSLQELLKGAARNT